MKLTAHLQQSKLLYMKDGPENLSVAENDHYRWLLFDNVVQSIMLKRIPHKLTIAHQYFLTLPLLFMAPKSIVEFGLGGGNLVRFLDHLLPTVKIFSIEQNQDVANCFEQFFNPQTIKQTVIIKPFELWLTRQKKQLKDWVIYDIYQSEADPQIFLKQISLVMNKLHNDSWLSINLPDLDEHELNIALLHLSSIKESRDMRYFHVPQYKNIIIHLSPIKISNKKNIQPLPIFMSQRWSKLWQHGMGKR